MSKYTVYSWKDDDEGGLASCLTKDFTPARGYHPETGCWARPSVKLFEFDTYQELKEELYQLYKEWYSSESELIEDAEYLWKVSEETMI